MAIPGLGMLYGAGAVGGAIGGFDFGLIAGGIAALFIAKGVHVENGEKYHDLLKDGKFLVVAEGNEQEVNDARLHLEKSALHTEINTHLYPAS